MSWIRAAEDDFAAFFARWITIQVEREDWIGDQTLVVHIIEWWYNTILWNGTVAQAKDAIEFSRDEY